jgi:hypothetical protein
MSSARSSAIDLLQLANRARTSRQCEIRNDIWVASSFTHSLLILVLPTLSTIGTSEWHFSDQDREYSLLAFPEAPASQLQTFAVKTAMSRRRRNHAFQLLRRTLPLVIGVSEIAS